MLCPFCKEEILDGAVKCKHCKSMLSPNRALAAKSKAIPIQKVKSNSGGIGFAVVSFILGLLSLIDMYRVASSQNMATEFLQKISGYTPMTQDAWIGIVALTGISILTGLVGIRKGSDNNAAKGLAYAGIICSFLTLLIAFGLSNKGS